MPYTKQEILERFIRFKAENGEYPTRRDLGQKDGLPGKSTIYRIFGNLKNAIKEAELFEQGEIIEEGDQQELKRIKNSISKKGGFRCRLCGSLVNYTEQYHSDLSKFITRRFIELLENNNEQSYSRGILDCIHAVFGSDNQMIRNALRKPGFLEAFNERFGKGEQYSPYKLRCYICKELKDEWEITVDTSTRPFAENICEDCLSKKEGGT